MFAALLSIKSLKLTFFDYLCLFYFTELLVSPFLTSADENDSAGADVEKYGSTEKYTCLCFLQFVSSLKQFLLF